MYDKIAKLHFVRGYNGLYAAGVLFALPTILLVGTVFYVLIERPCMDRNWPKKLGQYARERFAVGAAS